MTNAIKIIILAVVAFIISLPFFREEKEEEETVFQTNRKDQLLSEKESLYATIKELDFDHEMGKLSDEDYEQLKNEYTSKALAVLKTLDQTEADKE
jgi:hypothetical protein